MWHVVEKVAKKKAVGGCNVYVVGPAVAKREKITPEKNPNQRFHRSHWSHWAPGTLIEE